MMRSRRNKVRKNHLIKRSAQRRRGGKPSRLQKFLRWTVVAGFTGICILGVWGFERVESVVTNWTAIEHVTIMGLQHIERKEVLGELSLAPDTSIFEIHTDSIVERLESHPWVHTVAVERIFPHTLAIRIVEREAAAIWESSQGKFLLDAQAHVLSEADDSSLSGLPILIGLSQKFAESDDPGILQHVRGGIQVGNLVSSEFHETPTVNVEKASMIIADIKGLRFQFGDAIEEQWQRFLALYPSIRAQVTREATEVDLRYTGKVILRKRE